MGNSPPTRDGAASLEGRPEVAKYDHVCNMNMYAYIYIYIYIERERGIYIYIYINMV